MDKIESLSNQLIEELRGLSDIDLVDNLNRIRKALHDISPFKSEPVDLVLWIPNDKVVANDYNPNKVAPPEMKLLEVSIKEDGYTQPIVTWERDDVNEVVDGFHRHRVGKESEEVRQRVKGYLPIVEVGGDSIERGNRIASTIRHNRARGKHTIDGMAEIVLELKRRNWSDSKIGKNLGMDPDEILRLSQITGLAEMFKDKEFTEAWEVDMIDDSDNLDLTNEGDYEKEVS